MIYTSSFRNVAITQDEKYLISGSWDKTILVWNVIKREKFIKFGYKIIEYALMDEAYSGE